MKITFLGTAAATSYPLAFCRCDFCNQARVLGGKNFRKRSSVIINDDLLIDMGPDIVSASFLYKKSIADIRYCLQTHSHADHFDVSLLATRLPEYLGVNTPKLCLYGSNATLNKITEMLGENEGRLIDLFDPQIQKGMNLEIKAVGHLETFQTGNYQVTSFPAEHDKSIDSLLYAITEDNFTVFYGTDTNLLPEETWAGFHEKNLKFNVLILDHTYGADTDSGGHLNANKFKEIVDRMRKEGLLADNARILATHISHEGNPTHDELSKNALKLGYEIAFDGLVI